MPTFFKILIIICFFSGVIPVFAQSPSFYHLATAEGLSDNNVTTARRDKNGILWIGTTEGLNSFDGNSVTRFYKYSHPELPDNNIRSIEIDNNNDIWIQTASHYLVMLDGNRKFHPVLIGESTDATPVTAITISAKHGLIALKGNKHYKIEKGKQLKAKKLPFSQDSLVPSLPIFFGKIDDDKTFFYGNSRLVVVDYSTGSIVLNMEMKSLAGGAAINNNELLVYPIAGNVFYRISLSQRKIIEEYRDLRDQENKSIRGDLRQMARINEHRFAITSRFSGVYLLDLQTRVLNHWYHDPLDQRSIGGNNTFRIHYDTSGYLFITTQTSGLHYFNVNETAALTKTYFKNERGEVFDGYVEAVTTAKDRTVYLGAQDRLLKWNRRDDITTFIQCRLPDGTNLHGRETIRVVDIDEAGNLWVGTTRYGILILDKKYNTIAQISSGSNGKGLPSNWINSITTDLEGNKWIATMRGICVVEKTSLKVLDLSTHPHLGEIGKVNSLGIWFDRTARIWVGTSKGAWCYNPSTRTTRQYSTANGLPHNTVLSFCQDNAGAIYLGTPSGLAVLEESGIVKVYNRNNGLRNDKCEDMLKDDEGFIWIGNLSSIVRFDPRYKKFAIFEDGHGINQAGFRIRSCWKTADGEMLWGTDKGLTCFYPKQIDQQSSNLKPHITALTLKDTMYHFTGAEKLYFPYNVSDVSFRFSSGELAGGNKTAFLYRLAGLEEEWREPLAKGQVAYSKLPPGEYRFELKASADGMSWIESLYPIEIVIQKPWWHETWFKLIIFLFLAIATWVLYRVNMNRKKTVNVQKTIDYFAHSGYEHSSVDDILWDISRNCISRLDFEDCVIYLLDAERQKLVQKAAYGPKSPRAYEIANPIEIKVGQGIVGSVAETGKAIIIKDTSKDNRYIIDDERRFSEISVPIVHEGKVIGVIDSENKRKNFYTQQQLRALQTIASLCSAKISRAMALEAMKKSKAELKDLNVKMTESKFLNLRLQMNPHFLFNSLSSIQHLIVSQQTHKAYKYLTTFSNFLRLLLHHAEDNFIPLEQEVKILGMYIELESLRFDQSFQYEIIVDEGLANEVVLLPSLMVQPFAENAIWHGLLHKEGDKKLTIEFRNQSDDYLTCIISDNGIGRERSAAIKSNKIGSRIHKSKGINIIMERLDLLGKKTGKPSSIDIQDLTAENHELPGTKVSITIPYYNEDT